MTTSATPPAPAPIEPASIICLWCGCTTAGPAESGQRLCRACEPYVAAPGARIFPAGQDGWRLE
jgi:hypothetical protein